MAHLYQFNPTVAPDSEFVSGALDLLVVGNVGRALDPRRTPVRIVRIKPDTGFVVLEITDFEDKGAHWEIAFESIEGYQFARDSKRATDVEVTAYRESIRLSDQPLQIAADPSRRALTQERLRVALREASAWLNTHGRFQGIRQALAEIAMEGPRLLREDFETYMQAHDLADIEGEFAGQYVRNPHSGELVKGHQIVLAELGLAPFAGKKVRDSTLFDGRRSRDARAEHIVRRLSFVRALFATAGVGHVILYRGLSCDGQPRPARNGTFISATFHKEVALSHFDSRGRDSSGILIRQRIPIDRLFMSYLETGPMNAHYKEAEAVLLFEEGNSLF